MAGSAWTNQLVNLIILSAAQEGFSGFFAYSPAPAAGNLAASVAAVASKDPFDDEYLAGLAAYSATLATALAAGFLAFYSGSQAGGWTQEATIETDSLGDLVLSCLGTIQLDSDAEAGSNFTVDGTLFVGGASGGSITATNFNMNPAMGIPANYPTSGKTLAQTQAALDGLIGEMQNRGLIS